MTVTLGDPLNLKGGRPRKLCTKVVIHSEGGRPLLTSMTKMHRQTN